MNKFCTNLNINLTPLKHDIEFYGTAGHQQIPASELHPELVAFFKKYNLIVLLAEMFYNGPNNVSKIHIDSVGGDYSKVNFVWGGENSQMVWYKSNDSVPGASDAKTRIGTKFISFTPDEVDVVHQQSVGFPSIVQVGIPHNVVNSNAPRWCLSIVPARKNGKRLTMDETFHTFKDLLDFGSS